MTRDEAVVLIKDWLARPDDTDLDAKIVRQMKYVQESICENHITLPWFLLSEFLTIITIEGEERIPLPDNFLREQEECALWIKDPDTSKWVPLVKDDYDLLAEKFPDPGMPKGYDLGKYFRVKPVPDAAYEIRQRVYQRDTALDTNIENNWLKYAGDWFLNEVTRYTALRVLRDTELAVEFEAPAKEGRAKLFIVDEARKQANREPEIGD